MVLFVTLFNHFCGGAFVAGLKRDANIFKVLKTMRGALQSIEAFDTSAFSDEEMEAWKTSQRRFVFNGEDVRAIFVSEFEDFLFSCEWTDSQVVKDIVSYIKSGVPLNQIGDLVGLKNSAFRMRVFRITTYMNDLLFDGQTCPEGIYSLTDFVAIKKCLVRLRLVRDPVDVNVEYSLRQIGWMDAHIGDCSDFQVGKENMDKYFQSVLFLALTSRTFNLNLLDGIDQEALGYALRDMRSSGVNSTKLLFNLLLQHLTSDSVACREELATAKREYQDFMRG